MSLIQPLKFRTLKMGCFKMPRLQMPHLQMAIFQMGVTVASGLWVHITVVTFLLYLGQKVSSWYLIEIISHSLFVTINIDITSKNHRIWTKNTSKNMKFFFFGLNRVWSRDLRIMRPACYKRAMETCCYRWWFFMVLNKTACIQKIFALLTPQSWELEKK